MPTRHGGSFWKKANTYRRFNCRDLDGNAAGVVTELEAVNGHDVVRASLPVASSTSSACVSAGRHPFERLES